MGGLLRQGGRCRRSVILASILSTAGWGLSVGPGHAQETGDAEARRLFERGTIALADQSYDEAASAFEASLELVPRSSTAFNLGIALSALGRSVEASRAFRAVLEGAYGVLDDQQRADAASGLAAELGRVGIILLQLSGARPSEVRLDGTAISDVRLPETSIQVDPGHHSLQVLCPDGTIQAQAARLEAGAQTTLVFDRCRPAEQATDADSLNLEVDTSEPRVRRRRALWSTFGVVGAVAVGVAIWLAVRPGGQVVDPTWGNPET